MAYYAFLDENNIVTEVIRGNEETDISQNWEQFYGELRGQVCKRTSYNGNIRKNYAGIGFTYSYELDAFIPPKPYESWVFNNELYIYSPPFPAPQDENVYEWDEDNKQWVLLKSSF
jgi:hypothetical protein